MLCSPLERYHQFVNCKLAGRDHSIPDILTDCSQQGVDLVILGLSWFPLRTLRIDPEKAIDLFPPSLEHIVFQSPHSRYSSLPMVFPVELRVSPHKKECAEPNNKLIPSEWVPGSNIRVVGIQCHYGGSIGIYCTHDCQKGSLA